MPVSLYDGWKVNLNVRFRTTDVRIYNPSQEQIHNMNLVYDFFTDLNWTPNAIAGMLGNMMVESSVNPWYFQHHSLSWDDPAAIMADGGGMGLTQWTPCNKYYGWAVGEGLDPASGWSMCKRIQYEQENNKQWSLDNILQYSWTDFINSTQTPEILARVFLWAYERPRQLSPEEEAERNAQRGANARWCFEHIHGSGLQPSIMVLLFQKSKRKEIKRPCQTI